MKNYPFEVPLPDVGAVSGGVILADQVKSLSWQARNATFGGKASAEIVADAKAKLSALLQLV